MISFLHVAQSQVPGAKGTAYWMILPEWGVRRLGVDDGFRVVHPAGRLTRWTICVRAVTEKWPPLTLQVGAPSESSTRAQPAFCAEYGRRTSDHARSAAMLTVSGGNPATVVSRLLVVPAAPNDRRPQPGERSPFGCTLPFACSRMLRRFDKHPSHSSPR